MNIPVKLRFLGAGAMLFAAVAVDFMSKVMSVAFDLFFIALAVFVLWPVIKSSFASKAA